MRSGTRTAGRSRRAGPREQVTRRRNHFGRTIQRGAEGAPLLVVEDEPRPVAIAECYFWATRTSRHPADAESPLETNAAVLDG